VVALADAGAAVPRVVPRVDKAAMPVVVADLLTKERRSSSDADIKSDDFLHVVEVGAKADTVDAEKAARAAVKSFMLLVLFDGMLSISALSTSLD